MPESMTRAQQKIAESLRKSHDSREDQRRAREVAKEIITREKKFERAKEIGEKYAPKFAGTKTRYQPPLSNYDDESAWIPDPKEPSSPRFNDGLSALGLRWRKHEIVLDRWKPPSKSKPTAIDRTMRTKYAACAALRLSYWCDGFNGTVITVDEHRRFVSIDIDHKRSRVRLVGTMFSVDFTVGDTDATLDLLATDQPAAPLLPEPDPAVVATIGNQSLVRSPITEPDLSITREVLQSAVAHIRQDNSYVTDTETAVLVKLRATRGTSFARDIMPLIIAELERRAAA